MSLQLIFNKDLLGANAAAFNQTKWNYTRAGLARNLLRVKAYYNSRPFAVKSNHLLCKIINTAALDIELPIEQFYRTLDAKADKTGMHFKLTSPIHSGQVHDGIFYGERTQEVIIADNQYFDPYKAISRWRELSPVRAISHPRTELDLYLPRGKDNSTDAGTAVIAINIPMLLCMWRGWATEQVVMMKQTGTSPAPVMEFVHRWVLPGMLASHLDQCIVNRACRISNHAPMGMGLANQAFRLIDYSAMTDTVLREIIQGRFEGQKRSFETFLKTIPSVVGRSAQYSCQIPQLAPTRQYRWAEMVARVKVIHAWVRAQGVRAKYADGETLNDVLNELHMLSTNNMLVKIINFDESGELRSVISEIYEFTQSKKPGVFI